MEDSQEVIDRFDIQQIEDISSEYGKLMDWFQKEFPEGTITLDVNQDKRFGTLTYDLRVMSGKEMSNEQRFLSNKIVIDRARFENPTFMFNLVKNLYPSLKKEITTQFNEQYKQSKEKSK